MQPVRVDLAGRDRSYRNLRATRQDSPKQLLAPGGRELFRVVQQSQRPHAMVAQTSVVQKDARDDERPCQRAAPGLVGAGDEPRA
jgi:hypothetical protein